MKRFFIDTFAFLIHSLPVRPPSEGMLERFSYDLEMKTREQKTETTNERK